MKRIVCLTQAFCVCISALACSSESSVVVLLERQHGKPVVYIDGVVTADEEMYAKLGDSLTAKGRDAEVSVLFNPSLSFSEVLDTRMILHAVGFGRIRYYYMSYDKAKMAEVELSKPVILVPADFVD